MTWLLISGGTLGGAGAVCSGSSGQVVGRWGRRAGASAVGNREACYSVVFFVVYTGPKKSLHGAPWSPLGVTQHSFL